MGQNAIVLQKNTAFSNYNNSSRKLGGRGLRCGSYFHDHTIPLLKPPTTLEKDFWLIYFTFYTVLGTDIAQWYSTELWAGWSGVRVPPGAENFSLYYRVQTGYGTHPASYPMDARGSFPGDKAVGGVKLNTHLHLVSRTKNVWSYISIPPIRLHGVVLSQGHLYLYFYTETTNYGRTFGVKNWICFWRGMQWLVVRKTRTV
jgi:hypothetical protein